MKKLFILIAMLAVFTAVPAQSHLTSWHSAKASVVTAGSEVTTSDASVILNMDDHHARLSVRIDGKESDINFGIKRIDTTKVNRTVYVLDKKSSVAMFDTDEGTLCKFVINSPDNPDWDKIVLLFYM